MKNKYLGWAILAIAIIAILFLIFAFTAKETKTITEGQTTTTQGGWLSEIWNAISNPKTNTSGTGGTSGGNWWDNLFGGKPKTNKYCDCNKPGYALDGTADSLCNSGSTQFEIDCLK